ncbi:MAG: phosphate acyltransferase PlsX [Christensenellales bacterium]
MRVIVDAMGGDNAPHAIVEGCVLALEEMPFLEITLTGKKDVISNELQKYNYDKQRINIVAAAEVIDMAEPPVAAIRTKTDSSLVKGLRLLREGEGNVFVTAGSTGAAIAGATLIVRRPKGVKRPALAPLLPTAKGRALLIDCGANAECRPSYLAQFALMGSIYMQKVEGVKSPRVGLVSNGAEEEKGNELTKEAFKLIRQMPVNFVGNAEGRDLVSGDYDVIVCDGFTGNVVLKFMEGVAGVLMGMLKNELNSSMRTKIGAALAMPAFKNLKKSMDYTEYGGALLLGVNGGVVKAHGSSNAKAIKSTLRQAAGLIDGDVVNVIKEEIAKITLDD